MSDKVLKVSRRYLVSFLSYRENTGGGNIYYPTSAARVKLNLAEACPGVDVGNLGQRRIQMVM